MNDLISRAAAIDAICEDGTQLERQGQYSMTMAERKQRDADILDALPSAQPERLTDDDFETIRIHLSAYKERLCNQHRWKEAEEYQKIIDRFISFASVQPEVAKDTNVPCKDTISRRQAIDRFVKLGDYYNGRDEVKRGIHQCIAVAYELPSVQPKEVIPHRNYKYLSDYWCACGWHLGKKGDVKYCANCGRKVNWDD